VEQGVTHSIEFRRGAFHPLALSFIERHRADAVLCVHGRGVGGEQGVLWPMRREEIEEV
jgi:hypothetical protein